MPAEGGILHDQQEQHHHLQKLCKGAKINDIVLFVNVTSSQKHILLQEEKQLIMDPEGNMMVVALHSIQFCTYQRVGSLNICRVGLWVSLLFITCVHDNNNKINIRMKKCTYVYTYIRIHATILLSYVLG